MQPRPKKMPRGKKEEKVEELADDVDEFPVVGILDMHGLPAKQLQEIKKEMKEFAKVRMSRKTLMELALDKADRQGVDELKENDAEQPAFIFSEKDPFQLYSLIQNNKTSAAAQGGEEAPDDIEIPEGDTGIGPGPMLGKLQGAGLQVQVKDGTIHLQQAGILVEKGDEITDSDAEILNQVGIEPLEIGLDLKVAYADGQLFTAEELEIDTGEYRTNVEAGASMAFNLAVNAGVVNKTTATSLIGEASTKARNLSINEGVPTEDTIEEILSRASSSASSLDAKLDLEQVEVEEDEEEEPEEESAEGESEETGGGEQEDEEGSDEEPEEEEGEETPKSQDDTEEEENSGAEEREDSSKEED